MLYYFVSSPWQYSSVCETNLTQKNIFYISLFSAFKAFRGGKMALKNLEYGMGNDLKTFSAMKLRLLNYLHSYDS